MQLTIETFSLSLTIAILELPDDGEPRVPSLLGQSVLDHLALFHSKPSRRLFFLDADEEAALAFPEA